MENKDKVIESLNSIINDLLKRISNLEYEEERLNNIIDELEKWLKKEMKDLNIDTYVEYKLILNKIKELKGSDKE